MLGIEAKVLMGKRYLYFHLGRPVTLNLLLACLYQVQEEVD
jgi:hypothetical protein